MKPQPSIEPQLITDIVWVQTGFIGDIVLSTAALELAAQRFPKARQHMITTRVGAEVLKGTDKLTSTLVFAKSGLGLREMRRIATSLKGRFSKDSVARRQVVVLQAHRSYRSSVLTQFLGYRTITFDETHGAWLADRRVPRVAVFHEASRLALPLEGLGVEREDIIAARPRLLPIPLDPNVSWQRELAQWPGRVIGVAPGSVWGTKRWTPAGYIGLIERLVARDDQCVVLLGSRDERPLAQGILEGVRARRSTTHELPNLKNLAGITSLDELRAVYPRLNALVSNDSSQLHYASAFNVPAVGIFGATIPEMGFGPLATESAVAQIDLACRPCGDHGPQVCPLGHFKCMRELSVETVNQALADVLA